jgi:hypothetical protein
LLNNPHPELKNVSRKFTGACTFKFTVLLKHDAMNTYGEMGQKFPAFLSSEIERNK